VALKAGAVANVSIDVRRLLQARCFSAIGLGHKEASSTGFQDLQRAARLPALALCPQDVPPSVVHSWFHRTRARIRSAPIRGASDVACLPGRRERLPLPEVRALAVAPKVRRCSVCPIAPCAHGMHESVRPTAAAWFQCGCLGESQVIDCCKRDCAPALACRHTSVPHADGSSHLLRFGLRCRSPNDGGRTLADVSANLRGAVNPVAQLPHHSGERIKSFTPRLSRDMRATQLIADPLKIRLKLCLSAHHSPTSSFRSAQSHRSAHPGIPGRKHSCLLPSRAAGRASNPVG